MFLQVNQLLGVLLESELNSGNRYESFRDKRDKTEKTLLHYAAELGFLHVTKTLVKRCPPLLAGFTRSQLGSHKRAMLPVELALTGESDGVAPVYIMMMVPLIHFFIIFTQKFSFPKCQEIIFFKSW